MANLVISKTVNLIGTWNENIVTDDILQDIVTRARTQKGKKIKVKATEVGIKLTRAKLFQETQSNFFPITNLQTVMRSEEFPKCVMLILTDPVKKYKILAFRCESDTDSAQLTSVLTNIQSKVHSPNIELKKRDNGNWTLRGRTFHNANMHMLEIFNEHKQSNGEVIVAKANGDADIVPVPDQIEVYANGRNHKDTEHNKSEVEEKVDKKDEDSDDDSNDDDDDDNYVIETEVTTKPYIAAEIHADRHGNDVTDVTTKFEHVSVNDVTTKHEHVSVKNVPTKHEQVSVKDATDSSRLYVYEKPQKQQEAVILPSQPIVYRATSSHTVSSQPVVYNRYPSGYEPMNASLYYTDPWAQRRMSRESSVLPTRLDGYRSNVKFDQQSILSNTSRMSRSRPLRSSELSIPTTVRRSIEHVYPRPVVILRRRDERVAGYRPRPASYHAMRTNELRVYHEDDREAAVLL